VGLTISKEDISKLPIETFNGNIVVIDHGQEVAKAIDYLFAQPVIGFDTETRPTFTSGKSNKVALLQLSTEDTCFLFRLNLIGYPDALKDIICSSTVKKIGLSLRDDFAAMRKRSGLTPENFIDLQIFADKFGIDDNSLQRIYAIIFGKKISKSQRLSNWEAPELSYYQLTYAALDAWACLRIYNHLMNGGKINGTI
jgi:ribonuclease D